MLFSSRGAGKDKPKWLRVLLAIPLAAILAAIILAPLHPSHALVRQYLSIFLSWPAVALTLGLIFLLNYWDTIDYCLKKLFIKTPGGYQIKIDQGDAVPPDKGVPQEELLKPIVFWWASEWLIRYMFRSQFRLLRAIEQKGMLSLLDVNTFYNDYLSLGGSSNYRIDEYIGWLSDKMRLIEKKSVGPEVGYYLTEVGSNFLDYCRQKKYLESEFRPL
jgi:hypothetical protein